MINTIHSKNLILENLNKNQLVNVDLKNKLNFLDLKRISSNIENDMFGEECCLWSGPIITTNGKKYISFFFNGKKISLNRLLYINFVGELKSNEYLKYSCENNGTCCNVKHIYKINKTAKKDSKEEKPIESPKTIEKKVSNIVSF